MPYSQAFENIQTSFGDKYRRYNYIGQIYPIYLFYFNYDRQFHNLNLQSISVLLSLRKNERPNDN